MVKNFQGLNRMRSTPAMNNSYKHGDNAQSPPQHSREFVYRPARNMSVDQRRSDEANDALREILANSNLAEQANLLNLLKENVSRGSSAGVSQDYPPVPSIPAIFNAATTQSRPVSSDRNQSSDFLTQQMAQLENTLRAEHVKLDKILADAKATLSSNTNSAPTRALRAFVQPQATKENAKIYTKPFTDFLTENPTVFHAVDSLAKQLTKAGYTKLSERDSWDIKKGGKYYVERNGSSLIAFVVGEKYEAGNGAAILAGHVDALTAKLKPVSQVPNKAGFVQLGVAPYAGGLGPTWWDRDLSIGGRVLVKEGNKVSSKLVKLGWPIAKIPTLAPHFGAPANGPFNQETQMTPIIGLESAEGDVKAAGPAGSFTATQPPRLVRAIANELGISENEYGSIIQWELELYDITPAGVLGLDKEFITAGRIDDKLCSWAALQALLNSASYHTPHSGIIKIVGLFDDEEIGSGLRQGAKGNFLPILIERAVGALAGHTPTSDLLGRTYANSFIVSSDVTHSVNPNFESVYLANHAPQLNVGVSVSADSNGHMTTDAISTAIFSLCAERVGAKLQVFQIRNDSRSGGTVGPMLSSMTGIRAIDAGIPQLSMHSIRATTGSLDPGLGVICFEGFLNGFEDVDRGFKN